MLFTNECIFHLIRKFIQPVFRYNSPQCTQYLCHIPRDLAFISLRQHRWENSIWEVEPDVIKIVCPEQGMSVYLPTIQESCMCSNNVKEIYNERNTKVGWHKVRNVRGQVLFYLLIALPKHKGENIISSTWRHDTKMQSWI